MNKLMLSPVGIVGAVVLLVAFYFWARPRPIPGVAFHASSRRSLLGDIPGFLKFVLTVTPDPFIWLGRQAVELKSPIFQLWIVPFGRPTVFLLNHRETEHILKGRVHEFDRAPFFKSLFAGTAPDHSIRMPTNDTFRAQRRYMQATMATPFINEVAAPHFAQSIKGLVQLWRQKAAMAESRPIQIDVDLSHATLDGIFAAAFGFHAGSAQSQIDAVSKANISVGGYDKVVTFPQGEIPEVFTAVEVLMHSYKELIGSPFPNTHVKLQHMIQPKLRRAMALKKSMMGPLLADTRTKFRQQSDYKVASALDLMMQREVNDKEKMTETISDAALVDELFGFVAGGHTTVTTLCWGLKFLADNQVYQTRLREALQEEFGDEEDPSALTIMQSHIPYLDAAIEEILRLAQTVPSLSRITTVDTEVLGRVIPKGTEIFFLPMGPTYTEPSPPFLKMDNVNKTQVNGNAKHQTPDWNDADISQFNPERWLVKHDGEKVAFDANAGPCLGFSLGVRGCFGRRMGYAQLRVIFTLLVLNIAFEPVPRELSSYEARQGVTRVPKQVYARMRYLRKQ